MTIVVVNYNHARFLPRCLSAIAEQTCAPDEVLVIDDASTDDSVETIASFASRLPAFRLIRHEVNQGVVPNMNEGLAQAQGTHVLFAAADDWIESDLVEQSMSMVKRFPAAGLCSALTRLAADDGRITGPFRTHVPLRQAGYIAPEQVERLLIRDDAWFNGNTTIVRREAALEAGGYRPDLKAFSDMFLNVMLALRHGACFIPRFLAVWRRMEGGYASALTTSPAAMFETLETARRLMNAPSQSRFPQGYVSRWTARWRFTAVRACLALPSSSRREWLGQQVWPGRPIIGFAVEWLARVPSFGGPLATALLFFLIRFSDMAPVLRRRMQWLWLESRLERAP